MVLHWTLQRVPQEVNVGIIYVFSGNLEKHADTLGRRKTENIQNAIIIRNKHSHHSQQWVAITLAPWRFIPNCISTFLIHCFCIACTSDCPRTTWCHIIFENIWSKFSHHNTYNGPVCGPTIRIVVSLIGGCERRVTHCFLVEPKRNETPSGWFDFDVTTARDKPHDSQPHIVHFELTFVMLCKSLLVFPEHSVRPTNQMENDGIEIGREFLVSHKTVFFEYFLEIWCMTYDDILHELCINPTVQYMIFHIAYAVH